MHVDQGLIIRYLFGKLFEKKMSIVVPLLKFPIPSASSVYPVFDEHEASLVMTEIFNKIDVPVRRSESAPKTVLLDFFGTPNAGKTATTEKIEQLLRRHKFNTLCPPETAEIQEVRAKATANLVVEQGKHLIGVEDYVLNYAYNRNYHAVILSRGLIDMLFWYEFGLKNNQYSEIHVASIREHIYELLRQNLVDVFIFFTCSTEKALEREYAKSVTKKRGSKMTEEFLGQTFDLYKTVLENVNKNVPGLPIFHVDTTDLDILGQTQEVVRCVLPTLWVRFNVPIEKLLPKSLSLLHKEVGRHDKFEEQLKLRGLPKTDQLRGMGWELVRRTVQEDTYISPTPDGYSSAGEVMRIRKDDVGYKFMYKGPARDKLLSHRLSFSAEVSESEAKEILGLYPELVKLTKRRAHYRLNDADGHFFSLHLDSFVGKDTYTEIRALGSSSVTHTGGLLVIAQQLGFSPADMIDASYLDLALAGKL